jgi:5-formyltetrahydrofolate cyclo-ligase
VLRDWLAAAELTPGSRIAAYEPLRTEPGSVELLADLTNAGYVVLVPLTRGDNDLDWTVWTGTRDNRQTLGVDAIGSASLVLVPAFAVDPVGNRLGRGGGSYDRALARIAAGTPVAAVLFAGEVLAEVPTDPWDRPVTAVITPDGWQNLPVPH